MSHIFNTQSFFFNFNTQSFWCVIKEINLLERVLAHTDFNCWILHLRQICLWLCMYSTLDMLQWRFSSYTGQRWWEPGTRLPDSSSSWRSWRPVLGYPIIRFGSAPTWNRTVHASSFIVWPACCYFCRASLDSLVMSARSITLLWHMGLIPTTWRLVIWYKVDPLTRCCFIKQDDTHDLNSSSCG
jgi:hypothetical protein